MPDQGAEAIDCSARNRFFPPFAGKGNDWREPFETGENPTPRTGANCKVNHRASPVVQIAFREKHGASGQNPELLLSLGQIGMKLAW